MPLGISFYIFLSISYITDVYQSKLLDIGSYGEALLALGFFPIILAGPIQRPIGLLPQIRERRLFNYNSATDGLRQILWGMFMKIVIADKCAIILNPVFDNPADYSGSTLILALFLFSVQIYTDFAGYSNIAIGICKLLGFSIMQNFSFPYFSRDIKEFWKKWNISLTMWFRDYVFLPVAYAVSRRLKSDRIFHIKTEFVIYTIGIAITWTLTGLWHGANVTFILWGLIHGIFLILNHILSKPRKMLLKELSIRSGNTMLAVADNLLLLCIVMLTWIFFRSESVAKAMIFLAGIFTASLFSLPVFSGMGNALITMVFIVLFFLLEWHGREGEYGISRLGTSWPKTYRWSLYLTLVYSIFLFAGQEQQFIYFQF